MPFPRLFPLHTLLPRYTSRHVLRTCSEALQSPIGRIMSAPTYPGTKHSVIVKSSHGHRTSWGAVLVRGICSNKFSRFRSSNTVLVRVRCKVLTPFTLRSPRLPRRCFRRQSLGRLCVPNCRIRSARPLLNACAHCQAQLVISRNE